MPSSGTRRTRALISKDTQSDSSTSSLSSSSSSSVHNSRLTLIEGDLTNSDSASSSASSTSIGNYSSQVSVPIVSSSIPGPENLSSSETVATDNTIASGLTVRPSKKLKQV